MTGPEQSAQRPSKGRNVRPVTCQSPPGAGLHRDRAGHRARDRRDPGARRLRRACRGMVAARALAAQSSEFMAALRFARAQALLRGSAVTVCASAPGGPPLACQAGRAADWRGGWIVFADRDRRGVLAPARDAAARPAAPAAQRRGGRHARQHQLHRRGLRHRRVLALPVQPAGVWAVDAPPAVMVCVSKQGRPRLASAGACD